MKNIKNTIYIFILALLLSSGATFAQENLASTSPIINEKDAVEIFFPMEKSDFLLYYGVSENEEINTEIDVLRKDFIEKLETVKAEYEENFIKIIEGKELIIPTTLQKQVKELEEEVVESEKVSVSSVKAAEPMKKTIENKQIQNKTTTSKVILTDKKEILMTPLINISSTKTPYTETSTWFQKIKALFKW